MANSMKVSFYTIRALTNMQPGSGEATQGVVDNFIQRDPATGYPVIFGSSLKGALRAFMEAHLNNDGVVSAIFGNNEQQGSYRFFSAHLIALPLRSNKRPYYLAISPSVARHVLDMFEALEFLPDEGLKSELVCIRDMDVNRPRVKGAHDGLFIEDFEHLDDLTLELTNLSKLLHSEDIVVLPDEEFYKVLSNENLPVIARNYLENGISKNLWYEQVIPRFSVFVTPLMYPANDGNFQQFHSTLTSNLLQIGGNATVGYGYCRVDALPSEKRTS